MRLIGHILSLLLLPVCLTSIGCGTSNQSTVSSDLDPLLIVPKERVGLIQAGMTLAEIETLLGPSENPSFGSGKQRRAYPKLGLTLHLTSDGSKTLKSVHCGSDDPKEALVNNCKHSTIEEIGIGSSRDEVTNAYGPPSKIKTDWFGPTPEEGLYYESLGLRFLVTKGKIHGIIVFL